MRTAIVIFTLLMAGSATADYDKGMAAYKAGDYKSALQDFLESAAEGHGGALFTLGYMYQEGQGVIKDYSEAMRWYRKAEGKTFGIAEFNLGKMYEEGYGVSKDQKVAVEWYRKAAEQGEVSAQLNLGISYATGKGVIQDYVYAYMWVNISAANGNSNGSSAREIVAEDMTSEQIAEAQRLSRECVKKEYKNC
jgi:TPR repeat protein